MLADILFEVVSSCLLAAAQAKGAQLERAKKLLKHSWLGLEAVEAEQRRRNNMSALRMRLASLASMPNARARGYALEAVLNDLFKIEGLSLRDAFVIQDKDGCVQEQIDGLIVLDGQPILLEAKWLNKPVGLREISRHLVRLYDRAEVMGLFVSASRYTKPAIDACERMLSQRVIVLAEVSEILWLLENPDASLKDWLQAKIIAAKVERKPLFYPTPHQQFA